MLWLQREGDFLHFCGSLCLPGYRIFERKNQRGEKWAPAAFSARDPEGMARGLQKEARAESFL